jgi:hypothetical protein
MVIMRALLAAAALCCLPIVALAQTPTAQLTGKVSRGPLAPIARSGVEYAAPVAGAVIEITTPARKAVTEARTDSDGRYSCRLTPGTFRVRVASPVAGSRRKNPISTATVKARQTITRDFYLDTGIRQRADGNGIRSEKRT